MNLSKQFLSAKLFPGAFLLFSLARGRVAGKLGRPKAMKGTSRRGKPQQRARDGESLAGEARAENHPGAAHRKGRVPK